MLAWASVSHVLFTYIEHIVSSEVGLISFYL